jgi:hypothetical protein
VTRTQYWLINGASVFVALLIALEIRSVHELDDASARTQRAQAPLVQAQREEPQFQRLIQRTAVGSTRDPALKDLLTKYGISVKPLPATADAAGAGPATLSTASASPSTP